MLYPVAHIIEFEIPHDAGKTGAELFERGIECPQAVRLSCNVKRRLSDFRAFPGGGQIEIRFGGTVVVQGTVEAGTLKFSSTNLTRKSVGQTRNRCAAECAVRFEPMCANTGFFATSTKCFRAG